MIVSEFPPKSGGTGHYVYNLSKKLVEKGHRVAVITRGSWKGLRIERVKGINLYKTPFVPAYPFHVKIHGIYVSKLFRFLESSFDVVHFHVPLPPSIRTSLPTIVTVHALVELEREMNKSIDLPSLERKLFSNFHYSIGLKLLRNADLITTVSKFVAKHVQKYFGYNWNDLPITRNGVDTKFFKPGKFQEKSSYILYAGSLDYRKGLLDLVTSAKYICRVYPNIPFILVGTGPFERRLKKTVNKLGLYNNFSFVGNVNRDTLLKYYQKASIFMLPSYYESMPCVLLEAMACGLPIIATSIGGTPEFVLNGKTGFLVPMQDPKALASVVLKLLRNNDLREEIGKSSRERVERYYSLDTMTEKVLNCYKSIT